jgi:hypothetical protein
LWRKVFDRRAIVAKLPQVEYAIILSFVDSGTVTNTMILVTAYR